MKEIKFIYGQEKGLVVENQQKDDSIFFEQYQQAHHLIQNIEQSMSNDSPNMLAFCGDRGDGKTSCMQSVLEQIKDAKVRVGEAEISKYVMMKMIDPAFFDKSHNIVDLVVGSLYNGFKEYKKSNPEKAANYDKSKKLLAEFQKAKRYVQYLSNRPLDCLDEIDELEMLSSGISLKDNIDSLIEEFLRYVEAAYLIIPIDDLDLNMTQAYRMCEEIRKYLCNEKCLIFISMNVEQLNKVIENAIFVEASYPDDLDRRSMAAKYVSKLIPVACRIYMPKVYDISDRALIVKDKDGGKKFSTELIKEGIPRLIFTKTRYLFYNNKGSVSRIIPNNLRDLRHLIGMLVDMIDYDPEDFVVAEGENANEKIEEERLKNKKIFRHYFFNTWTRVLSSEHRELASNLVNYSDTTGLNKYVVQQLKDYIPETEKSGLVKNIINPANYDYNVSLGDVFFLIDYLDRSTIDENVRNLLFFIRSFYSMKMYECYDIMTESVSNMFPDDNELEGRVFKSDAWFKRTNAMQRLVNGSFFTYEPSKFLAPHGRGRYAQTRDYKVVNGKKLSEILSYLSAHKAAFEEGDFADEKEFKYKCWLAEYFALCIIRSIRERDTLKFADLDRTSHVPYYLTTFNKDLGCYVFDIVSIFYNIVNVKYCYSRFSDAFNLYEFAKDKSWTLLGQMMRRAVVKDWAEEEGVSTVDKWEQVNEDRIMEYVDTHIDIQKVTEGKEGQERDAAINKARYEYMMWRLLSNASLRNAEISIAQMENMESRRYANHETKVHSEYISTFYEELIRSEMATYQKNETDDENKKTKPYFIVFEFLRPIINCFTSLNANRYPELREDDVYVKFVKTFNSVYEYIPGQGVSDDSIYALFPHFFNGYKAARPTTIITRLKEKESLMYNALTAEDWKFVFTGSEPLDKLSVVNSLKLYYEEFSASATYYRLMHLQGNEPEPQPQAPNAENNQQ